MREARLHHWHFFVNGKLAGAMEVCGLSYNRIKATRKAVVAAHVDKIVLGRVKRGAYRAFTGGGAK